MPVAVPPIKRTERDRQIAEIDKSRLIRAQDRMNAAVKKQKELENTARNAHLSVALHSVAVQEARDEYNRIRREAGQE